MYSYSKFPASIQLETHNYCNSRCLMCPHDKMKRPKGVMGDKLLYKLLKEILNAPEARILYPHHINEPLIDDRLGKMVQLVKHDRPDIKVLIYSNCILLQAEMVHWQFDQLVCSLDAASKDTYYNIKGVDQFDNVLGRVGHFIDVRDMYGYQKPGVTFNFTVQEGNYRDIEKFYKLANPYIDAKKGDCVKLVSPANFGGFQDKYLADQSLNGENCARLKNCHIQCDGKVVACCYDYEGVINLGDVNDHSIREVWNNRHRAEFLKMHVLKNYPELCARCNMR